MNLRANASTSLVLVASIATAVTCITNLAAGALGVPAQSRAVTPAHSTAAPGVNLSWDDCGLAGSAVKTFSCDNNAGAPFTLIGSFSPPPNVNEFLGMSAQVSIQSLSPTLPDWWQFGSGY